MFLIYKILYAVGFLALLPRFLFDYLRKGKYAAGFSERLGHLPKFEQSNKSVLWVHAVSVGETNAARPLIEQLLKEYPNYRLIFSTTTETGQNLARKIFADKAEQIFYMPFDFGFSVRRALQNFKPNVIIILETELWFNFIYEARKSGSRIVLVNGRLSQKSYKRYSRIKKTMARFLHKIDLALMQDNADATRIHKLGMSKNKVKITGNIKYDQIFDPSDQLKTDHFSDRFQITEERPLIVAASTHNPEERWILEAYKKVRENCAGKLPRLLIAPRHPERFAEVAHLIEKTEYSWVRRSNWNFDEDSAADIILLDSIGDLRTVYPLAEIVFIGGSLVQHGGQSILEPAMSGNAIVTGFYTANFAAIVKEFLAKKALVQLPELAENEISDKLSTVFINLLNKPEIRNNLRHNSQMVIKQNSGAVKKTLEYLEPFLQVNSNQLLK